MTTFMLNSFDKSTTQVMLSTSHFIALRGIYVGLIIDDTKFDHDQSCSRQTALW